MDVDASSREVDLEKLGNILPILLGDFEAHLPLKFFVLRAILDLLI